jgi:hypothetical protein
MTLPFQGGARFPGPLGTSPGTLGGRLPGPLRFKHVELKGGATKATKTVQMPPPWPLKRVLRIRKVDWKLSDGMPAMDDVRQGSLPSCPIASILAALAHTEIGRKRIDGMITEYTGAPVKTVVSDTILTTFESEIPSDAEPGDYKPQNKQVISTRYFAVPFWKGEVHDTFYVEYSDNEDYIELTFMSSPKAKEVLWPAVIEKACAFVFGSYAEMGNYKKHTVNEFWELIVGRKPAGFDVTDTTDLDKIRNAANDAKRIPTIGASKPTTDTSKVSPFHGHAILRMVDANTIELFDPHGLTKTLSLEDFRKNFQAVYYGTP